MKIKKLLCALLVAGFACTAFASCTAIVEPNAPAQNGVAPGALTYIGLRINPEIEMIADENGTIVSANAVNTDGEVVLSAVELEGKTAEDAVEAFTETAIDLGYMDVEAGKDTVNIDVQSESTEAAEKVEKSLSDKVMKFFEKKGIAGKVSKEVLDTYLAAAEEWNVTPGHAKMIARVLEANPELTYDELMSLTVKELLELLKTDKHADKIAADCKDDYKAAVKALKEEYKEMFELREEIEDIEDDLEDAKEADDDDDDDDDDKLTAEEIAALEAELAEKKAALKALEDEYNEKLDAIKAEFKACSKDARDEHKKEAEDRKQAKQEGKKYEKPEKDDDDDNDDDDDDDDRDDKKSDKKDDKDNKKSEKPEHDDDDDDDDDDDKKPHSDRHQNKGNKAPETGKVTEAATEKATA